MLFERVAGLVVGLIEDVDDDGDHGRVGVEEPGVDKRGDVVGFDRAVERVNDRVEQFR